MFDIGNRVHRIEARAETGGAVLEAVQLSEGTSYLIAYDEGGQGWWPEDSLQVESGAWR